MFKMMSTDHAEVRISTELPKKLAKVSIDNATKDSATPLTAAPATILENERIAFL